MKNNNQINRVIIFAVITIFMLSCATTNVFDSSIPKENTTTINMDTILTLKTYNGIDVNLKKVPMVFTGFTIPAGKTALVFDVEYETGMNTSGLSGPTVAFSNTYRAYDIEVTYNFEAGKKYTIYYGNSDIRIYEGMPATANENYLHRVPFTFQ